MPLTILCWSICLSNRILSIHCGMCVCTCAQLISHVLLFAIRWTAAFQAPLSMELSRQEYWRRLPFPTPGDLPNPEIDPHLLSLLHWKAGSFPLCHLGSPHFGMVIHKPALWCSAGGCLHRAPFSWQSVSTATQTALSQDWKEEKKRKRVSLLLSISPCILQNISILYKPFPSYFKTFTGTDIQGRAILWHQYHLMPFNHWRSFN